MKSQEGGFLVYKAAIKGCGMRQLTDVDCPPAGYDIPYLKEMATSSALYLIPLNSNIDLATITVTRTIKFYVHKRKKK